MSEANRDELSPEKRPSKNFHRRFPTVEAYVSDLGGSKARVIEKVLIANNGVGAVKAIRSIRRWAYEVFGNERAVSFVVMATPEDLRANAEYIRMGDVIVDVPGGTNNHNYANVTLIVELARLHGVHAVWAGWGHASENPALPDNLAKSNPPIKFIGPAGPPMRALGDKIGSTIIAQSAGVPCIAWNGDGVIATYDKETGTLPEKAFNDSCIFNAEEAEKAAEKIGFPVMIKASEGGGGKGIRMVDKIENVSNAYRQVCGEVPGSPIFIMKLSSGSRHLEVQLLADEYGDAIALNGRDCSVQRRHQKIIEEGPPVAAHPDVWKQMEQAAVDLAKAVYYTNAGTVEYLYSEQDAKFYFLELNPRLQVEHPVTEMITSVNLPAAQLQVAMGIPLCNIPEIRELYGRNRFDDNPQAASAQIDFDKVQRVPPKGHCIAVRITAENAETGFKPTSGGIQELNFRSTPNVWGYFSMDSSGAIHEFADSQFGHLFASGPDREQARRNMVLALKELSIRGDISTTVDYISKLIELEDFVANKIDTSWLDSIIAENAEGIGDAEKPRMFKRPSTAKLDALGNDLHAVLGATIVVFDQCSEDEQTFLELLDKGQLPPRSLLQMKHDVELILDGIKYKLCCSRSGPHSFSISVSGDESKFVGTSVRTLSDGGYLIDVGGHSHVAYTTSKGDASTGMKLNVSGATVVFSPDYDPSALRTDVAGKLVKKLKPDGAHVKKGEPYCEIEVMKMFMPLKVEESGTLSWCMNEGAALVPGHLLANLELDNPDNVSTVTVFQGDLKVEGWGATERSPSGRRPHLVLRGANDKLDGAMSGYLPNKGAIDLAFSEIATAVTDPTLPVFEAEEQLSVLSGRINGSLFDSINQELTDFRKSCEIEAGTGVQLRFPAESIISLLSNSDSSDDKALTTALRNVVLPYTKSTVAAVPGSERAFSIFLSILRKWISVERWFCDNTTYAEVVENLRRSNRDNARAVLDICRAHEQLKTTSEIVDKIIVAIGDGACVDLQTSTSSAISKRLSAVAGTESLPLAMPTISEISSMGRGDAYAAVALRARKLIMQESMPSLERRRRSVLDAAKQLSANGESKSITKVDELISNRIPLADVFFQMLKTSGSSQDEVALVELYARHMYSPYTLKGFESDYANRTVKFEFLNKPSERVISAATSVTSVPDLSRIMSNGNLNDLLSDMSESSHHGSDSNLLSAQRSREVIPPTTLRTGACALVDNLDVASNPRTFDAILSLLPQRTDEAHQCVAEPMNVVYIFVRDASLVADESSIEVAATRCRTILEAFKPKLEKVDVRRVSFVLDQEQSDEYEACNPVLFSFRFPEFTEDTLYRNIDPSLAMHLDLNRVVANFKIRSIGTRQTPGSNVHLYSATPRSSALAKDRSANKFPRVFTRTLSSGLAFSSSRFEQILVDSLNAMDLCSESKSDNHLFLNLLSDNEKAVLDPVDVERVVGNILKRHEDRISGLGIAEVETRIVCRLSSDSSPIALRLFASNPTGYVHVMNTYVEAESETGGERVFKLIGGTKASLASAGDSSWDRLNVDTPYPLTRPFDAQRKAALKATDTLYCYDLPALFEAAVEQEWDEASAKGGIEGGIRAASRPPMVMYTNELVVQKKTDLCSSGWTMQDYLNGDLELVQSNRGAGANDVGMVAWLIKLKTVNYPDGRRVVLIANDITKKAGSFGTREDVVFKLASEFARENRIPRLFIAANSGARIGLADRVKKRFNVAFKDSSNADNGFDFLYVTKEDYEELTRSGEELIAEPVLLDGQEVYRITDIIGCEPDLGVENLKGSGLIAGETSKAYDDIFTMTIVLGRTVGIGAYLVRLGQRTIQKVSASPIILTGYQALNKLMGVDVYSTNDQLGGPGIMYPNGVSHLVASDHLLAVKAAIDWLSFVPEVRGGILPVADIRGVDELERPIGFVPKAGVPYDPRHLLAGGENENGEYLSGFFDRGSFKEALSGWAKTVVVGRARLGGIPMGVIATENRTAEAVKPADPADVKASEAVIQEAGCVWFPNSAYKTAQAINDFRTEDLPLMIFANWRGFSGGQRDMFDEVLKYGSFIVDAFVAYEQPVFVFIPPYAEIRGGAWVVLDASINPSVMEMYAAKRTARGGVLEANGAASVKYRMKDQISTMHRLDDVLKSLDKKLGSDEIDEEEKKKIRENISKREQMLAPVYEQIAVQFCELHDTPGRMKAVGVIEKDVEWEHARSYFYWRLRRKLCEFDIRKQLIDAAKVGRGVQALTPLEATNLIKKWFVETPGKTESMWEEDQVVLEWMREEHDELTRKVIAYTKDIVVQEVVQVMTGGGNTARIGTEGIIEGLSRALEMMKPDEREAARQKISRVVGI